MEPTTRQLLATPSSQHPTPTISRSITPLNQPSTRPTHSANGTLLPAILCLHGGGSNATVYKIQCRRLIWTLQHQFRFIFVNAGILGPPGFGMIPVFESCRPFYRWVDRKFVLGESRVEITDAQEVRRLDEVLLSVMEGTEGGVGSFVGVMGFSQGARLVPGLLLRQKVEERDRLGGSMWKFRFGVMIGGPFPPISLHAVEDEEKLIGDYELLRTVPTVHAWGRDDHVKGGCVELWKACEGDECFQMDFTGGHHMPLKDGEANDLCDLILAAWYAGGGTMQAPGWDSD